MGKAQRCDESFGGEINHLQNRSAENFDYNYMKSEELTIIVWNVNKLRRHSNNPDFKQFCLFHDIVCLIETWAKDKDDYSTMFETHHPFSFVRSAENHFSGGIIAYVRNELLPGCVRIYENFNDLVVVKI